LELEQLLTQQQLAEQLLLLVAEPVQILLLMATQAVLEAELGDREQLQQPEVLQLPDRVITEVIISFNLVLVLLAVVVALDLLEQMALAA
jgi:hypothetical protein